MQAGSRKIIHQATQRAIEKEKIIPRKSQKFIQSKSIEDDEENVLNFIN